MNTEEFQFCPKCGAALNQGVSLAPGSAPGTVTCGACGTTLQSPEVASGAVVPAPSSGGKRSPMALFVAAIVAAAMLYFGVHMARHSGPTPSLTQSSPAPDFTLESLDGKSVHLSDLRGKAVLLNFWATWCGPCKIETPWLVELHAKDMGVNYPVLLGKEAVGDAYGGVPALPESFFIGRDGKIVDKIIGLKGKGEIEDSIKKALETQASDAAATPATALQAQK